MVSKYEFNLRKIEQLITRIIHQTGAKRPSINENCASILAYHEICDLPKEINRLHTCNVAPSAFEQQMEFLCKNEYSVIKLEALISCLTENAPLPHRSVVITLDDGYKNNYTNAFPILEQHNLPATIFLATNYIGSDKVFPWLNGLLSHDENLKENWIPFSWQEVEEMSRGNITFGSHTCSHSNIRLMNEKNFADEVEKSKDTIEEKTNRKVELFSYPFSYPKYRKTYSHLIEKARGILIKENFLGACTTIIGNNSFHSDPFCLKRIQIRSTDDLLQFRAKIEGAYNWVGFNQKVYQKIIEPLIEKRRGTFLSW